MKSMQDVEAFVKELLTSDSSTCYNGTVIYFVKFDDARKVRKGSKIPYHSIVAVLIERFSCDETRIDVNRTISKIRALFADFTHLTKSIERSSDALSRLLGAKFQFPVTVSDLIREKTPPRNFDGPNCNSLFPSPAKTRRDCINCSSAKKANLSLNDRLKVHKGKFYRIRRTAATLKKEWKVRSKNQRLKRLEERVDSLKRLLKNSEIKITYLTKKNVQLSKTMDSTVIDNKNVISLENSKLKSDIQTLKKTLSQAHQEVSSLRNNCDHLKCRVEELEAEKEKDVISTKMGKCYSSEIRRCVYNMLISDLPVSNCGLLLKTVLDIMGGVTLDSVPCRSTCAQMAYELGVISSLHLMEFMLTQKSLCLSWDATSIVGAHVNEIHLTVNRTQCLVLDIRHLAGGTNSDYVAHIMSALTDAAATYARYKRQQEKDVLYSLLSKIASTLSDRAAVNAVVTRQLCCQLETDLLQLNCNVHPLDGIAREVKKDLSKFDSNHTVQGQCYGTEGAAANLIKAVSVLRYKDGKGDPVGFMNFLRQNDIPLGAFPRYVGNRMHVLFHLAGVLFLYREKLIEFLEKQGKRGLLPTKLLLDLKNAKIVVQVWALAVLGKTVTGPWMTKFYSSTMSNLEMGPLLRRCVTTLESWIANPSRMLHLSHNVFGDELTPSSDAALFSLTSIEFDTPEIELQIAAIKCSMESVLRVVLRQLGAFVDGRFSAPTTEMMELAANAPTHNMASERALGSLDRMWRRAPNATLGFLNGKVRSKLNKTLNWLEQKDNSERDVIVQFAVKEATSDRARKSQEQKSVFRDIAKLREEVSEKRDKARRTAIVKSLNSSFSKSTVVDCGKYSKDVLLKVQAFITDPCSVIGTLVLHTNADSQRYARIQSVKKGPKLRLSYWSIDESESHSTDSTVSASSFFADVVLGSIVYL